MKSLSSILLALAAGTVVGLLLAPESGKETRQRISKDSDRFFKDLQDQLQTGLDSIKEQYNDLVDTTTSRSKDVVDEVKSRTKY